MSLLSHNEIQDLLDQNIVEYAEPELINSASLDIRLGKTLLIERIAVDDRSSSALRRVSLRKRQPLEMVEWNFEYQGPFIFYPGEFILAHSHEVFNLPNWLSASYALKSSMARIGLEHLNAGWCDAGWNNSVLTLELKNMTRMHEIELNHLDKIGQMCFFRHSEVHPDKSYATRGRYNGDRSVSGTKAIPMKDVRTSLVFDETEEQIEGEE